MDSTVPKNAASAKDQYSLSKILCLWAAVAIPAGLSLVAFLFLAPDWNTDPLGVAYTRMAVVTVPLVWTFVLSLIIVYLEEGNLHWVTITQRLRLNIPLDPKFGNPRRKLWWWLVPLIILHAIVALFICGPLDELSVKVLPFLSPPKGAVLGEFLSSPDAPGLLSGAWGVLGLFLVVVVFNILGEEFFWRGVMLPKMNGVFGKWDWVSNGVIGGAYHLSQPWQMLGSGIFMWTFLYAMPAKYFRSTWFSIIIHGSINVLWTAMLLGLILS